MAEQLTNFDKWQNYTSGLSSPQNYIDWAWVFLVGAALQRRVWLGPDHQPCFANKYVIFCGEPGIGKGLPIKQVALFLKHWKKKDTIKLMSPDLTKEEIARAHATIEAETAEHASSEFQGSTKGSKELFEPLLFPVAADATTYEALVKAVGESHTMHAYVKTNKDGSKKLDYTGHCSLTFCLEELASLFRKRTEDTINYMLGLYDCPLDYEYVTLSRGKDRVRRGCLNMIAGTTPSFMQSTFDDRLADEGFNSRTFYVYAKQNRKNQFFIPALSEEQERHRDELLAHIRQLSSLYGNVKTSPETDKFLQEWWDEQEKNKDKRVNKSIKLKPYYSRRNIHVMKIAMALHFSESTEMFIPLETFKRAIAFLEKEEENMHLAIHMEADDPIAKLANKVLNSLSSGQKNFVELMVDCKCKRANLMEAFELLTDTKQIKQVDIEDPYIPGKMIPHWALIEKK